MKKIVSFALVLTSALLMLSSCKEVEKAHAFFTQSVSSFSGDDKSRVDQYLVDNYPYFGEVHTYFGLWEDSYNQAFEEFAEVCETIDNDAMTSQLPAGGTYVVCLIDSDTGQIVAYSQAWEKSTEE